MYLDCVRKKILYIGLALVVIGIAVAFLSPGVALPAIFPSPVSHNITVMAGALGSLPIYLNESGLAILTFNSSAPVDFYLTNSTAFASISAASQTNSSPRLAAIGLEGNGVYELYQSSTSGVFPYTNLPNVTAPAYLLNVSLLQPGTYYALFYNTGNASARVSAALLPLSLSAIQSGETSIGAYFGVAAILFIVGVALSIFAFVSKGKQKEVEGTIDADAAREYDRIERKKKGRK